MLLDLLLLLVLLVVVAAAVVLSFVVLVLILVLLAKILFSHFYVPLRIVTLGIYEVQVPERMAAAKQLRDRTGQIFGRGLYLQ